MEIYYVNNIGGKVGKRRGGGGGGVRSIYLFKEVCFPYTSYYDR